MENKQVEAILEHLMHLHSILSQEIVTFLVSGLTIVKARQFTLCYAMVDYI